MELGERRGALAKVRDHACQEEQRVISEMSRAGREESAQQWARTDAKQQAAAIRAQRAQIKERKTRRDALWELAFGSDSLFRGAAPREVPSRACEVCPLTEDVRDVPELGRLARPAGSAPEVAGNLANALSQVLLRIPKVASWLAKHTCQPRP